jgi:hypothetical protein
MPENLNPQPAPADRPPDPAAAETAAREARQRLITSRWPLYLWMGLTAIPAALLMLRWEHRPLAQEAVFFGWLFALNVFGLALPAIIRRLGFWSGAYALPSRSMPAADETMKDHLKVWLPIWLPIIVVLIFSSETLTWAFLALYVASVFAWKAYTLRLWELCFVAGVTVTGGVLVLTLRMSPVECIRMMFAVIALTATPLGIRFFFTWRRWATSLPYEGLRS